MFAVQAGQTIGQKIGQEAVKQSWLFYLGCSLVSKDTPKLFLDSRHRLYIHMRSTPAGQQLPNLKSQEVTALYLPYKINDIEKFKNL